jgi:outer membrane protein OmpA-like peptidoglycan-associated protein
VSDNIRKIVPVISSTKNTEFSPTISADGRMMIFESDVDKKKGWELFESRLDSAGKWSEPYAIKNINEKCDFLAGPSLSYDGNTLFFTAFIEGTTKSEDIYYSTRLDDKNWSEPKSIGAPINTDESYEGFPSISADENSLYFIRLNEENAFDKKSKEACFKIYVSQRQPDGKWGTPEALPAPINLDCERDPKIMADNHTLVFSSIRPGGKGKYDLYQTRKQPDGSWADPIALDFINAEDNDQSPCISASGDVMFFYSLKDLYSVSIPQEYRQLINVTLQGFVKSETTQQVLSASIVVKNITEGTEFTIENNSNDGSFSLVLAAGKKYSVNFMNKDYLTESLDFDFEKQDRYLEIKKDIILKSNYLLDFTVLDPDLNTGMNAWVSVTSGSEIIFKDSVKSSQYPLLLQLKAGKNYQFKAAAPEHPEIVEDWKFDQLKTKAKMTHSLNLPHEKTKYIASVTNITTNQKLKIKVTFNNQTVAEVIIVDAGEVVYLRKGDRYQVVTSSDKGYFFTNAEITAGEGEKDNSGNFIMQIKVVPVEQGAQLTLDNIRFATNSADLDPSSYVELDKVIELLKTNATLSIEIAAHTDDVGTEEYNLRLSEKRALSVVRYLLQKGTKPGRLKPVGYGKTKPVASNENDEERSKNRRVELLVLKSS